MRESYRKGSWGEICSVLFKIVMLEMLLKLQMMGEFFSKIHALNGIRTCLSCPSEGSGFNGWFGSFFCSVVIPRQNKGV